MKAAPEKILLIQLRQLGDILLTTPVIRAMKEAYPKAQLSFLTHPMGRLILDQNPLLDEHLIMPASGVWGQTKFLAGLRQKRFDLVFDFMGNPRSALATFATLAAQRVGFQSPRSWAYNVVVPRQSGEDYIVEEKFRMLAKAGITGKDQRLMLPWTAQHLKVTQEFFAKLPEPSANAERLRVVLSPTHRRENRRWPLESWRALAEYLVTQHNASVFWAWGPGEEEEVRVLQQSSNTLSYLMPKTSFRELAAFISQVDLFVGNSNGPSHVAVAVNTPSIQLHGPTDAPSWCPMTQRHVAVAASTMDQISVSAVIEALQRLEGVLNQERQNNRGAIRSSEDVWRVRGAI